MPDTKEEDRILLQAEAIGLLRSIRAATIDKDQVIKLSGGSGFSDRLELNRLSIGTAKSFKQRIVSTIMFPLIQQGFDRYREIVKQIAETGEVPDGM